MKCRRLAADEPEQVIPNDYRRRISLRRFHEESYVDTTGQIEMRKNCSVIATHSVPFRMSPGQGCLECMQHSVAKGSPSGSGSDMANLANQPISWPCRSANCRKTFDIKALASRATWPTVSRVGQV